MPRSWRCPLPERGGSHRAAPRLRAVDLADLERLALQGTAPANEEALGRSDELAACLGEDLGGLLAGRAHKQGRPPITSVERRCRDTGEACGWQPADEFTQVGAHVASLCWTAHQ